MLLKSGLNCGQGLSENDVLWSLNHSFTINSVIVVLEYAREEKRKSNPLMEKYVHSVHLATLNIDLNHSVIELIKSNHTGSILARDTDPPLAIRQEGIKVCQFRHAELPFVVSPCNWEQLKVALCIYMLCNCFYSEE